MSRQPQIPSWEDVDAYQEELKDGCQVDTLIETGTHLVCECETLIIEIHEKVAADIAVKKET